MKTSTKYYYGSSFFIGIAVGMLTSNWWHGLIAITAFVGALMCERLAAKFEDKEEALND